MRPWNSQYKAILGGAQWIVDGYISKGQDTLYLQRFDIISDEQTGLYWHQYMTSTQAPVSEAIRLQAAYKDLTALPLVFSIPIYNNMPENCVQPPPKTGNPNNWIRSISVLNQALTPSFDPNVFDYDIIVSNSVSSIEIEATKVSKWSALSGVTWNAVDPLNPLAYRGTCPLNVGENTITITCTAQNSDVRNYNLHVIRLDSNNEQLFTTNFAVNNQYISGISEQMTAQTFLSQISMTEGTRAELTDRVGVVVTDMNQIMKTGDRLLTYNSDNVLTNVYYVVLFGDPSGDGRINSYDLTVIARHVIKVDTLPEMEFYSADVDKSGKLNSMDLTLIAYHIIRTVPLQQ
jgi:hypothetical protein